MNKKVSCIIVDDEPTAREILRTHLSRISSIEIVAECKNAIEAFNAINTKEVNLIFLDINMPEISGLSFAKTISKNAKIIFTTAYREYAIDGFDLKAVDYLLKPISFERLLQAVNSYFETNQTIRVETTQNEKEKTNEFIFVRSDRKMVKINFNDIFFVESLKDYLKIFLKDKTIVTRETISNIEDKLPKDNFIRIHRSNIISIDKIESYTHEYVDILGRELIISRQYKQAVLSRLENL